MFSTSMIASSTTSPRAMTRPGEHHRVDRRARARSAAARPRPATAESPVRLMSAVRQSNRKAIRIDDHQDAADRPGPASGCASARSMNVAGRKIVGSISTPVSAGCSVFERRFDAARHFERVAFRLLFDDQQQARAVVDDRVANRRRRADLHLRPRRAAAEAPPIGDHSCPHSFAQPILSRECSVWSPL